MEGSFIIFCLQFPKIVNLFYLCSDQVFCLFELNKIKTSLFAHLIQMLCMYRGAIQI